jgi:hypothetical protein
MIQMSMSWYMSWYKCIYDSNEHTLIQMYLCTCHDTNDFMCMSWYQCIYGSNVHTMIQMYLQFNHDTNVFMVQMSMPGYNCSYDSNDHVMIQCIFVSNDKCIYGSNVHTMIQMHFWFKCAYHDINVSMVQMRQCINWADWLSLRCDY